MRRTNWVVAALVSALAALALPASAGWQPQPDARVNADQSGSSLEYSDVAWSYSTDYLATIATGWADVFNCYYTGSLLSKSVSPWCQLTRSLRWTEYGLSDPMDITLQWSGRAINVECWALAESDHCAFAQEDCRVTVSSGSFQAVNGKWGVVSHRTIQLPQNPPANQEKSDNVSGSLTVTAGLPGTITGTAQLVLGPFSRSSTNVAVGTEASDSVQVASSSCRVENVRSGTFSATAFHSAYSYVAGMSSDGEGWPSDDTDFDARALSTAETCTLSITAVPHPQ